MKKLILSILAFIQVSFLIGPVNAGPIKPPSRVDEFIDACADQTGIRKIWEGIAKTISEIDPKIMEALKKEFPKDTLEGLLNRLAELMKDPAKWAAFKGKYGIASCEAQVQVACNMMATIKPAIPPSIPGSSFLIDKCSWIRRCFGRKAGLYAALGTIFMTAFKALACKPEGNEAAKALKQQLLDEAKKCNNQCEGPTSPSATPSSSVIPYKSVTKPAARASGSATPSPTSTPEVCDECDAMDDAAFDALSTWMDQLIDSTQCSSCSAEASSGSTLNHAVVAKKGLRPLPVQGDTSCEPKFEEPSDECSSSTPTPSSSSSPVPLKGNLKKSSTKVMAPMNLKSAQ